VSRALALRRQADLRLPLPCLPHALAQAFPHPCSHLAPACCGRAPRARRLVPGLVEGASKAEGLGNTFLGHIRSVEALIHVVRCFESADVQHVLGAADPARDIEIINTELLLADLQLLDKDRSQMEKKEYLVAMGLERSSLARLVEAAYRLLDLITFYTITTDLQARTLRRGPTAPQAAGRIHSDFERGFIRAEVFHFEDLLKAGSDHHVREMGLLRTEGKGYVVQDGDIIHFLFNV